MVKFTFNTSFVMFLSLSVVQALEITFKPIVTAPHQAELKKLTIRADAQVKLMHKTVLEATSGNAASKAKVTAIFGASANLPAIVGIIERLDKFSLNILTDAANLEQGTLAEAIRTMGNRGVEISNAFWGADISEDKRVWTLVHEASHFAGPTYDYWNIIATKDKATKRPFDLDPVFAAMRTPGAISGYWNSKYQTVVEEAPDRLHENADTWGVFGYYLEHNSLPPKS